MSVIMRKSHAHAQIITHQMVPLSNSFALVCTGMAVLIARVVVYTGVHYIVLIFDIVHKDTVLYSHVLHL